MIQLPGISRYDTPAGQPGPGGEGGAPSYDSPDRALWERLVVQPTIGIAIPATAASIKLVNRQCILDGWILRDTVGTGAAVEFFDGADATGVIIGEQVVPTGLETNPIITDTDVDASSTGGAQANNVTLPGVAGQTTFISGFEITGAGATGAAEITITVTGILGGTKTYKLAIPAGAGVGITPLLVEFSRPIPASAVNTAIVVNVPSFGVGNTDAAVTAHGFQRLSLAGSAGAQAQTASGPGGLNYLLIRSGVFMRVIQGTVTGSLWIKV